MGGDVIYVGENTVRNNLNTINSLSIYTDITEYQIVGDTEDLLLQVISTVDQNSDDQNEKNYEFVHFVP